MPPLDSLVRITAPLIVFILSIILVIAIILIAPIVSIKQYKQNKWLTSKTQELSDKLEAEARQQAIPDPLTGLTGAF